jgi:phospholipid-binding lipoprotein MlaA
VTRWLLCAVLGVVLSGCGTLSTALRTDASIPTPSPSVDSEPSRDAVPAAVEPTAPPAVETAESAVAAPGVASVEAAEEPPSIIVERDETPMAQARDPDAEAEEDEYTAYDPWEKFNEKMFEVNRRLDRYVLKPVAKAYNVITPDELQIMISNGFDNISFPPRFVNSVLQGKFKGATREIARFLINSTAGVGGLFDPAKDVFGLVKSREDFGQTLGFYGMKPGPFLIVPLMEPMTVRDGIGKAVDAAMDPLAYYLPFIWERLVMKIGDTINERALNLDLFQGFEESVIDLYSAVRHGYLQRREKLIRE